MKMIKYLYHGNEVGMGWSEPNEAIAAKEADNGVYEIVDDGQPNTVIEPTTDDVLDALLGVSV